MVACNKDLPNMPPHIPTHLIAGPLGAGKTTTLLEWIAHAPDNEQWAVLINEYGKVAIDPALLSGMRRNNKTRLAVREVAGGCICCGQSADFAENIRSLVTELAPDRILIEPTGLANVAALQRELLERGERLGIVLESTLCVVDVRRFQKPALLEMPYWQGLLESADIILGSKADLAGSEKVQNFLAVVAPYTSNGKKLFTDRETLFKAGWLGPSKGIPKALPKTSDRPISNPHSFSFNPSSKGWIFPQGKHFCLSALTTLLDAHRADTIRIKGVFKTDEGAVALQSVDGDPVMVTPIDYVADNRLEIIFAKNNKNTQAIEEALVAGYT